MVKMSYGNGLKRSGCTVGDRLWKRMLWCSVGTSYEGMVLEMLDMVVWQGDKDQGVNKGKKGETRNKKKIEQEEQENQKNIGKQEEQENNRIGKRGEQEKQKKQQNRKKRTIGKKQR